jgi:integrase
VGDIGYDALAGYVARRFKDNPPAAPATVRNELAALKRALNLLRLSEQGFVPPKFPTVRVDNARQVFFEPEELEAVLQQLRGDLRAFVRCVAITGWRHREVCDLTWDRIDWTAKHIRLAVGATKNRAGRIFPFAGDPEMEALLRQQLWSKQQVEQSYGRVVPWVFHRPDGTQIRNLYVAWRSACARAGCEGKRIHDLRRTTRRRYVRSGVPEKVAMELLGHKTRAIFDRYHIVSDADMAEAVARDAALRGAGRSPSGTPAVWSRGGHADPEATESESA